MINLGLITNIQRFSINDGPGIRSTVFLKGCNLNCDWCHNPETKDPRPQPQTIAGVKSICGREITTEALCDILTRDKPFYIRSRGGVTFSGGEPMLQPVFLRDCLRLCKESGMQTAVDTAGNVPFSSFEDIVMYTDLILYDIKIADPTPHKRYTGVTNERIIDNLFLLYELCADRAKDSAGLGQNGIIIRIPLLPGINDDEEEFSQIANLITKFPNIREVDILPYHAMGESKYKNIGERYRYAGKKPPTQERAAYFQEFTQHMLAGKIIRVVY